MNSIAEVQRWKGMQIAQTAKVRAEAAILLQLADTLENADISPLQSCWKGTAADRYILRGLRLTTRIRYHAEALILQCGAMTEEISRSADEEIRQIRIMEELQRERSWTGSTRY